MKYPLKPKRGFAYRDTYDAYLAGPPLGGRIFAVDSVFHGESCIPVLVVPEPDREPTEAEVEELASKLFQPGNECSVSGITNGAREVARAAFRLGARVQA